MKKRVSIKEAEKLSKSLQKKGKTVGLVVGSFDIIHLGHINLFRCAKRHVSVLMVGLDNDATIRKTKGKKRPINNYKRRSELLSDLITVDKIFRIGKVFKHGDKESYNYFSNLLNKIKPTHTFTHAASDSLSNERKELAKAAGVKYIPDRSKFITHSSIILKALESEL